jgi:phosphatidylinositol alpha-1,6-mannosyltransferase
VNILIISADFPPWDGGIAQVGYEYARTFSKLGHQVTVVAPKYGGHESWDRTQTFDIIRYRTHNAFAVHYWLLKMKLRSVIKRKSIDWVLTMRWNMDGIALMALRNIPPVVFQWYHGNELFDRHLKIARWHSKLQHLMASTTINIAVSDYTSGLVARYHPNCPRVKTVHLGVDATYFHPPASTDKAKACLGLAGKKVILTLARLVQRKGHEQVIRSIAQLKDDLDIVYIIGGKGAFTQELMAISRQLGTEQCVKFVGFIPEEKKVDYYQACDIYVMPSKSDEQVGDVEGFGLTYLEANACGKPVIGSRQGGCPEAVADGTSGLLVDPDKPDELTDALKRLLQDEIFYHRMAAAGLKRAREDFSWQSSCRKLERIYEGQRKDCTSN